jgi:hypothetical protein
MLSKKASPWQDAHNAAAHLSTQLRRSPDIFDRLEVDKLCLQNLGCLLMSSIAVVTDVSSNAHIYPHLGLGGLHHVQLCRAVVLEFLKTDIPNVAFKDVRR